MSRGDSKKVRTVIVGAPGYSGGELATILLRHPHAEIVGLFGSAKRGGGGGGEGGTPDRMGDLHPRMGGRLDMEVGPADIGVIAGLKPDAVFLATPHEASIDLASAFIDSGPRVFDLSGAFRLHAGDYPTHYGFTHHRADLLGRAVYGLPELNRGQIVSAAMVAVPGCYPTSAILPLAPLVRAGAIAKGTRPIVDSVSGVSGAGRTPSPKNAFCEVSLQPYNVMKHRHGPEIELHSGTGVVFTPHLAAFDRGILSTIHVELAEGWSGARVTDVLRNAYEREQFVRLLPRDTWPSVAGVCRTNFCDIGWACDDARHHLILVSAIDNLVKGAAGQAIQCMNIRFDLPEGTGLEGAIS